MAENVTDESSLEAWRAERKKADAAWKHEVDSLSAAELEAVIPIYHGFLKGWYAHRRHEAE